MSPGLYWNRLYLALSLTVGRSDGCVKIVGFGDRKMESLLVLHYWILEAVQTLVR